MEEAMPTKTLDKQPENNQKLQKTKTQQRHASEINLNPTKDPAPGTGKEIMDGAAVPTAMTKKL